MDTRSWPDLPATREAAAAGRYGIVLRLARTAAGLTPEQAGKRAGYSAATLSRLETGRRQLTDVTVLRHLAEVFAIPPALAGAAASPSAVGSARLRRQTGAPPKLVWMLVTLDVGARTVCRRSLTAE